MAGAGGGTPGSVWFLAPGRSAAVKSRPGLFILRVPRATGELGLGS